MSEPQASESVWRGSARREPGHTVELVRHPRDGGPVNRLLMVSADGHAGGPPSVYRDDIEKEYLADLDALVAVDEEWRDTPPRSGASPTRP